MKTTEGSAHQPSQLHRGLRQTISAAAVEILTLIGIALLIASLQLQGAQQQKSISKKVTEMSLLGN